MIKQENARKARPANSANDIGPAIDFDIEMLRQGKLASSRLEADARRSGKYAEFLGGFTKRLAEEGLLEAPFAEHKAITLEEQLKRRAQAGNAAPVPAESKFLPPEPAQPSEKFWNLVQFAAALHKKGELSGTKLQKMANSTENPKVFKSLIEYECRRQSLNPRALLAMSPVSERQKRWRHKKKLKDARRGF